MGWCCGLVAKSQDEIWGWSREKLSSADEARQIADREARRMARDDGAFWFGMNVWESGQAGRAEFRRGEVVKGQIVWGQVEVEDPK